jgi:ABC-type transporter Mla MlaB component
MSKRKKATSPTGRRQAPSSGAKRHSPARTAGRAATRKDGRGAHQRTSTPPSEAVGHAPDLDGKSWPGPVTPATTLALAAECLVADASTLKANLAALLEEPQPVTLDITALQRIDTAGLQVITAFVRERAKHAREVDWQGSAPVLATAARLLGLTSFLKLPA